MRLAPLLLLAAAAPAPLQPGLWRFRNVPTEASLDGQRLGDLPAASASDEEICLTPSQAADPAHWLARDVGAACTLTRTQVGGAVAITGACPPADAGAAPGSLSITGTADATHYHLRFATRAPAANGVMAFAGTMTGRRTGPCVDPATGR